MQFFRDFEDQGCLADSWDQYKRKAIMNGNKFQTAGRRNGKSSGVVKNPRKTFFLKLAAESVKKVNIAVDAHGLSFARKAIT